MNPIETNLCNFTYLAPTGQTATEVGDLRCLKDPAAGSITSWWEPDAEERAVLAGGGLVGLTLFAERHPVVSLGVWPREDPGSQKPEGDACGLRWHRLSEVRQGGEIVDLMAAASDDGIGVMARWVLREDGSYHVEALDSEGQAWRVVMDFGEEESVPARPPVIVEDVTRRKLAAAQMNAGKDQVAPGLWECKTCGFVLKKSILYAGNGAVGADGEIHFEPCPNDGDVMHPITYKKLAKDNEEAGYAAIFEGNRLREENERLKDPMPDGRLEGWLENALEGRRFNPEEGEALCRVIRSRAAVQKAVNEED